MLLKKFNQSYFNPNYALEHKKNKLMKLLDLKEALKTTLELTFYLPDGSTVPNHFHVTEVGKVEKNFIDCGGTVRNETVVNFQLWTADDHDHRLEGQKLLDIITLSEEKLGIGNHEIEVEYQGDTIGKYGLEIENGKLTLTSTLTDCLAKDNCGIPEEKPKIRLSTLQTSENACTPGGGCC